MLDDFFTRALIAGIGVALIAAPMGCFIVWRRLSYFGDTLAHAGLLGVALGFLLEVNLTLAVFVVSVSVALLLLFVQRRSSIPTDAILGLMSHGALAIGLVSLSLMTWLRVDLMSFLVGDILAVSKMDIAIIFLGGAAVLLVLLLIWNRLFAATVSPELAQAEGANPQGVNAIFMVLIAIVIALSMKVVGVLLITALLIIPAATARQFSSGPEQMAFFAAIIGVLAVIAGLFGSLQFDTMSGPSIVVAAIVLFVLSLTPINRLIRKRDQT